MVVKSIILSLGEASASELCMYVCCWLGESANNKVTNTEDYKNESSKDEKISLTFPAML